MSKYSEDNAVEKPTIQAGGDIPLGDVVALSGTGGIAYFFDLGGTAFTWNGGIKFRF